mmetsp:Transcript_40948/g.85450  ORF Transcript_40948/g.85450 Transcript_40948/m.85450 type:complete len:573 (-) Transcript_40948:730-2448(-)
MDYYARHNRDYFDTSKPSGYVWKTHSELCPGLKQFIVSFKRDTMQTAANIARRKLRIKPNLLPSERMIIRTVLNKNVGFNDSDKNFGPVLYSRDLYLEQCQKHLFDGKGTYEYTEKPKDLILEDVARRLKNLLSDCFRNESATKPLAQTLTKWTDDSLKRARLANFYVIWKLHKKANAQGVRSRPISNNIGYPTGQVSHFLHCQLIDAVNAHTHVLKDSLSLIRQLESLSFSPEQNILLTSADVAALYPSINIEDGMKALQWFMAQHSSIPLNLQPKYLKLARFVLENNYVDCKGIEGSFLQKIGTAMGTSFSVTYATIFMIWLETPIINEFQQQIVLYKRYIDDIFLIWSGSSAELCRFREKLGNANENIKLEWQSTPSAEDAVNPAKFDQHQHRQVNFLDLDITIVYSQASAEFAFKVYRKPGTAYAYLPYGSYHARHVFRGWLKAEMHRLLTHSSSPTVWLEECAVFYSHLRNRGYPSKAIDSTFRTINWNQRSKMLEPKKRVADDKFFAQYRGCVFSNRNAPGSAELRMEMDLSLEELREQGQGRDIFPPCAFFASRSALPMGYILPR